MGFVHLHVHSPFSFLDGAAHIKEIVSEAYRLGMPAVAVTDHDNLSAAVRFHKAAGDAGIKPVQGAEITLEDGTHLTLLCRQAEGYANLCRLLTRAHLSNLRLHPRVSHSDLARFHEGLICLSGCRKGAIAQAILSGDHAVAREIALRYASLFGRDGFFIEISEALLPGSRMLNHALCELASTLGLKTVVTNNVHYTTRAGFEIHDVLTCIRTLTKIDDASPERSLNAENYLKSEEEMKECFGEYPQALANSGAIAAECAPCIPPGRKLFPEFKPPPGLDSGTYLKELVSRGAQRRYSRITPSISARLEHEMDIILRLGYEDYFLLVWDLVEFARRSGIRCSGRGSAADSAVAYCLNITDVDAIGRGLLFERFLSLERAQKPDIDVDFDARYRDDVTRYAYAKYGSERVATVSTYTTFRGRSSVRDVGKALGFSADELDTIAKRIPYLAFDGVANALERFPELRQSGLPLGKFETLVKLCDRVAGFPRHLGTHLGGVVICRDPLVTVAPLQMAAKGVTVIQFDKDDTEDAGLIKLDLLSLRTLAAVEDTVKSVNANRGEGVLDYDRIPSNDRETYKMINQGQTIGVFQLESPAQRALQSHLGADNFEDIVASVALIRPGPIKGNMVSPYVARRKKLEPVTYMHPKLVPILKKTYGVILFQEQVIEIATAIAAFTPGESDRLRRVMTHSRSNDEMENIGRLFVAKSVANGVSAEDAEKVFACMRGYASYGFCEAHAAAFAGTAIKTAYLVRNYPSEFLAAILSNAPMGYYPPDTICVEARRRGVKILGPCVNKSEAFFKPEGKTIRVSLRQVKSMQEDVLECILSERKRQTYTSLKDFLLRVKPPKDIVWNLILSGALDCFSSNRRLLLWEIDSGLQAQVLRENGAQKTFAVSGLLSPDPGGIADFAAGERLYYEHEALGISVSGHPVAYVRERLDSLGVVPSKSLKGTRDGQWVTVAGYPVRPHRPPTKSGKIILFMSLEDEFGLSDVTVFEDIYQKLGQVIFKDPCSLLLVRGKVNRRGNGTSVIAFDMRELDPAQ